MSRPQATRLLFLAAFAAAGCSKPDHAIAAASEDASIVSAQPAEAAAPKKQKKSAAVPGAATEGATAATGTAKKSGKTGGGGRGGGGQVQPVEVTNIIRRDLIETLNVVGSLGANETASVRPEMAGIIRSIHFEEGLPVKKGDLLLKIDDQELQAQVAQTEARLTLAQQNLERAESLRLTQSNTQADVDRARSEYAAAQADLRLLQVRHKRTEILAPFDGVVGSRTLSPGDFINTQSVVTIINDLSRLKAEFQVPERYIGKIKPSTPFVVKATTGSTAGSTQGEVYFVNAVINRDTRSSEVKGYLANPPPDLKAGMFAVIEIVLAVRKDALAVPEGAIFVDQRGPQLVVVRDRGGDKVVDFVPVKLGLRTRGLVEVSPVSGTLDEQLPIVAAGVGALPLFAGALVETRPLREEFRIAN